MKKWVLLLGAVLPFCLNAQSISSGSCGENCQYTVEDDKMTQLVLHRLIQANRLRFKIMTTVAAIAR